MEGYRELGFVGGIAVPAVVRFGHGFLQGVEHAAESLELAAGEITVQYYYLGAFAPSPEAQTMAAAWFAGGIEVIFAAAGGAGFSVIAAATDADASVIGVDVDQSGEGDVVITSAMKALDVSVYDMLTDFLNGTFAGGEIMFDATNNGVGLPMDTSRFQTFTQAQYEAIFALLADGTISVDPVVAESVTESGLEFSLIEVIELN
jgi:basic membrane protein A